MTADLITWLREQYDAIEAVAQAAREDASGVWVANRPGASVEYGSGPGDWPTWSGNGVVVYDEGYPTEAQAEHIALHDPAAVLADIAAKRRIVTHLAKQIGYGGARREVAEPVIRLLALPYADRPGYCEGWRP